ncbi:RluA family pseudouridine synthase [Jeotgalibaca sp. MA1X17-3]|uniref:RluA family pseudouridine synthase n=1 Tax=Jeotgalibaca sp. MA1X17-3 TaxID=2908211 RepID=UPI001F3CBD08|nr:RluA family pseudouridine synthase [Jeotgalibaca sp. MA1X17-3]UJF15152.1 RluA family pseudouridine synthase [Jeotgalibaca sp. MA1X17-3]
MIYEWKYEGEQQRLLKNFLREQGISKKLLAKIKYHGGTIWLNGEERNVLAHMQKGDHVKILIPDEGEHETTVPVYIPIEILYEDQHFLIVNKPSGVASIPSRQHPHLSMANRVKGYYKTQNYVDQVIHIVTRLDRDTTGAMLFAKSGYVHSQMDKMIRNKTIDKMYTAVLSSPGSLEEVHGVIDAPIGRTDDSIITRMVREGGKEALTEYWIKEKYQEGIVASVKLHTGRTHQIRVHFTHMGAPLLGDDLYGGTLDPVMQRQALHCTKLSFVDPFTEKLVTVEAPFPEDFKEWIIKQEKQGGRDSE